MKILIAAAFLTFGGSANAEAIWNNLDAGMTKDKVRELYPNGTVALTPDCVFAVIPKFSHGGLSAVWLKMGERMYSTSAQIAHDTACKETIKASIFAKYGNPMDFTPTPQPSPNDVFDQFSWINGSIRVAYIAAERGVFQNITYTYEPPKTPARADAGAASKL